jgi:hypothetical protein
MQWEYSMVPLGALTDGSLKAQLDAKGREGWELVAMVNEGGGQIGVFKRAITPVANVA